MYKCGIFLWKSSNLEKAFNYPSNVLRMNYFEESEHVIKVHLSKTTPWKIFKPHSFESQCIVRAHNTELHDTQIVPYWNEIGR